MSFYSYQPFTITPFYNIVLFALMQKEPKKSRQNTIAPRVFAIPRFPTCNSAPFLEA